MERRERQRNSSGGERISACVSSPSLSLSLSLSLSCALSLEAVQGGFRAFRMHFSSGEDCRTTECRPPVAVDGGVKSGTSLNAR